MPRHPSAVAQGIPLLVEYGAYALILVLSGFVLYGIWDLFLRDQFKGSQ